MYGIYANIGGILMVNVTIYIYSIHGSYGYWKSTCVGMGKIFHRFLGLKKHLDPVELWGTLFSDKPTWVWTMVLSIG